MLTNGTRERTLKDCEIRMKDADSKVRKATIHDYFETALRRAANTLDVRLPNITPSSIHGVNFGRGSEGPRALAAYYYAFLHTARKYGSSMFCPIVIDAPNQQGQDKGHLEIILRFLLSELPQDAQVIIGTEAINPNADADIIDVTWKKDQVLREDAYEQVAAYASPFFRSEQLND